MPFGRGPRDDDVALWLGFNIPLKWLVSDKVSIEIVGKTYTSCSLSGTTPGGIRNGDTRLLASQCFRVRLDRPRKMGDYDTIETAWQGSLDVCSIKTPEEAERSGLVLVINFTCIVCDN